MANLLLAVIYIAFISLGLPDAVLGAAWPTMSGDLHAPISWAGGISMTISAGTIVSALLSDRMTLRFGAGKVTAVSVALTAFALFGFSISPNYWMLLLFAIPYGLGAGGVDAALNNYVAIHYESRHMSWLHAMWGLGTLLGPYIMASALGAGHGWAWGYRTISILQVVLTAVLVLSLPLTWKTAAVLVALMAAELLMLAYDLNEAELAVYLALHILILGAAMWQVLALRKLQQGGENLAKGDFSHPITLSRGALPELKRHAANLNSVQQGIQQAVEEKMKSERLKTQLITNVSHDIKTPLTSIVNYVDLLKKEEMPSDSAREYLEVLDRQSQRLRKLTEDLVEASKASTGNIPVSLAPTDLNVLLSQVCGEYQQRLEKQVLEPVLSLCEPGAAAMADGRLLWRVLDNLMSNICKYAMPGTRVYLTTEREGDTARMVVKNISRYPLNISADELTERFVRGDSSRSTEGSGLGLSIATSLMSLQGGDFRLTIDGDLFKVTLTLPAAETEE